MSPRKIEALDDALSFTLGDWERMLLGDLMEAEGKLDLRIKAIEKEMLERLKPHIKALEVLQTMPGIDTVAAASILAETGPDMAVFGSVHSFTAWAGLSPGNNESAGKRRYGATRKGSKYLRATLVEAAWAATRTGSCQVPRLQAQRGCTTWQQARHRRHRAQDGPRALCHAA